MGESHPLSLQTMMLDYFSKQDNLKSSFLYCFAIKKGATDFKNHFMDFLIYITLVPTMESQ